MPEARRRRDGFDLHYTTRVKNIVSH
jgi:hypothetical protein